MYAGRLVVEEYKTITLAMRKILMSMHCCMLLEAPRGKYHRVSCEIVIEMGEEDVLLAYVNSIWQCLLRGSNSRDIFMSIS